MGGGTGRERRGLIEQVECAGALRTFLRPSGQVRGNGQIDGLPPRGPLKPIVASTLSSPRRQRDGSLSEYFPKPSE